MRRLLRTTLAIICILCFHLSFSQNKHKIDSLLGVLETQKEDTLKVETLNELAWVLHKTDAFKARGYARDAIKLSKSLAFERGRIDGWVRLGQITSHQKEYEKAEEIWLEVLDAEIKINDQYGIGRAKSALADVYRNKDDLKKALNYGLEALDIFEKIDREDMIALISNKIGYVYEGLGSYDEAMEYFFKGLEIRLQLGNQESIGSSYLDIGTFYKTLEDYPKALEYLNKSKTIFEKQNDEYELAKVYNNLGTAYYRSKHYGMALRNYHKSLSLKKQLGLEDKDPNIYNNIGGVYYQKNDLGLALEYYLKSISIQRNTGKNEFVDGYINVGNIYYRKKNYREAIAYYRNALDLSKKSKKRGLRLTILNNLSYSYAELGEQDTAWQYSNRYIKLNDSIEQTYKAAVQLKADYEEKQKENIILEKDKEILAIENERKKNIVIGLISGIILLSVLFFAILKIRHQKQNIKLAEKDRRLKGQKIEDLLKDQELKFKDAVIEGQDKERKRIARDLHDSLGSMLSTVKMYFKTIEENIENLRAVNKEQYGKANDLLDSACKEVRKIAYNMNEGVLMDFGLVPALADLKNTLEETNQIKVDFIAHGLTNRLDNNFEISLYKIIQELINNILKHSGAGKIIIQLIKSRSGLNVMVEDNGIGFDVHHRKPSGMGLANVASRIEALEGELHIDSTPGNGTIITIDLPLIND